MTNAIASDAVFTSSLATQHGDSLEVAAESTPGILRNFAQIAYSLRLFLRHVKFFFCRHRSASPRNFSRARHACHRRKNIFARARVRSRPRIGARAFFRARSDDSGRKPHKYWTCARLPALTKRWIRQSCHCRFGRLYIYDLIRRPSAKAAGVDLPQRSHRARWRARGRPRGRAPVDSDALSE